MPLVISFNKNYFIPCVHKTVPRVLYQIRTRRSYSINKNVWFSCENHKNVLSCENGNEKCILLIKIYDFRVKIIKSFESWKWKGKMLMVWGAWEMLFLSVAFCRVFFYWQIILTMWCIVSIWIYLCDKVPDIVLLTLFIVLLFF